MVEEVTQEEVVVEVVGAILVAEEVVVEAAEVILVDEVVGEEEEAMQKEVEATLQELEEEVVVVEEVEVMPKVVVVMQQNLTKQFKTIVLRNAFLVQAHLDHQDSLDLPEGMDNLDGQVLLDQVRLVVAVEKVENL